VIQAPIAGECLRLRFEEGLLATCAKDYSDLKATMGSTRVARRTAM